MNIISTNKLYDSAILRKDISLLKKKYPFLNIQIIGFSTLGIPIYVLKLGKGSKHVFYSASFHANESITTNLLMKFVEDYCIAYNNDSTLYNYSVKKIYNDCSIFVIPMVNPDGIGLIFIGYFLFLF